MQLGMKLDQQMRAMAMAIGGAAIASVVAMFVPVGLWETLTGSTGISEMIPATAAPLGDTARAMIAFGVGALTFALLAPMLLRRKDMVRAAPQRGREPVYYQIDDEPRGDQKTAPSLISRLKEKASAFIAARRGAGDISGLEDLPKLRPADAHPDAPPRRPLRATRDLVDPEPEALVQETLVQPSAEPVAESEMGIALPETSVEPALSADVPAEISSASLAEMIDRLETALAERQQKLAQLEALIGEEAAAKVPQLREVASEAASVAKAAPVVEAVASAAPQEAEEMDAALRSALQTLHRMNARTR